jgi:glycosyltransferase involved in cell wall biosynthesis
MITINLISLYYEANRVTGANKRFDFFAKSLMKNNDVDVIAIVREGEEPSWSKKTITVPRYESLPSPIRRILHFIHLSFICAKLKGVIVNDFMPMPLFTARNKNYFQLVHDIRNFTDYNRAILKKASSFIQKYQWKNAPAIMTVSQFTKNQLVKYCELDHDKVFVSYNGMEESYKKALQREIDFLYIATFEKRKNHKNLVIAFAEYLKSSDPSARLVLVGRDLGYRESINQLIDGLDLRNNITVVDNITEEELADTYQRTHCFVSPSFYEGFGMPIIEAMYYGCNIACSDIEVFKEVAKQHANYFDPDDIDSISNSLRDSRAKSNNNATQIDYVRNNFLWDAIAESFLHLVRK